MRYNEGSNTTTLVVEFSFFYKGCRNTPIKIISSAFGSLIATDLKKNYFGQTQAALALSGSLAQNILTSQPNDLKTRADFIIMALDFMVGAIHIEIESYLCSCINNNCQSTTLTLTQTGFDPLALSAKANSIFSKINRPLEGAFWISDSTIKI